MQVQCKTPLFSYQSWYAEQMSHMSLVQLRVFCEIAECLSVTHAALRLHRTQPAVSRQLAELERELGVALFLRHGRQLSLTAAGEELHARAKTLLTNADDLVYRAQELSTGRAAMLRVGAMSISMEGVMSSIVLAFKRAQPRVAVHLVEADAPELACLVETGQLDLAFSRDVNSDALSSVRLFPMYLSAMLLPSHPLSKRTKLEVKDLEREPLLLTPPGTGSRVLLARACQADGITLRDIRVESRSYGGLIALAEGGYGIAVALSTMAFARPGVCLHQVCHHGEPLAIWFSAIRRRDQLASPHADAFIRLARKMTKDKYPGKEYEFARAPRLA